MANKENKVRRLGINLQIMIPTCIMLIVICVGMGINAYSYLKTSLLEMGAEEATMASKIVVDYFDGDEMINLDTNKEGSELFEKYMPILREAQERLNIKYGWVVYESNGSFYYWLDSSDESEDGHLFAGDPFPEFLIDDGFYALFDGVPYVNPNIVDIGNKDYIITAIQPIVDSTGKVRAVVGCDYNGNPVIERLNAARNVVIGIAVLSVIIGFVVVFLIVHKIMKALRKVNDKLFDIVENGGDLTQKLDIHTGDEMELIANKVNALLEYIRGIMKNISGNSGDLIESSEVVVSSLKTARDSISGVSATMEEMSAAMQETSASLTQVNEAVETIDGTVQSISDKAVSESKDSETTSKKVQEIAKLAESDRADALAEAMKMSQSVNEKIESSKAVEQINDLTEEILNITDQTGLLALNANIEAARAGEAGRGFAVVASEIGSLATSSAKVAEQIKQVSNQVVGAVNELAEEAERMLQFMNETAMAGYDKLLENSQNYQSDVEHLSKTMGSFATESAELKQNIEAIKEAINSVNIAVDGSTKGIVSVTEEASDLAGSMEVINDTAQANKDISGNLNDEVGKFVL